MALPISEAQLIEFAKTVELTASRFLEGAHRSARRGEGLEFHSHAAYGEGEDARRIDWRRWAASERLYVRKFEKEEKLGWALWLDQSLSMNFGEKRLASYQWTATLLYLAQLWADSWMLYPESPRQFTDLYHDLLQGRLGSEPKDLPELEPQPRSQLILISDFFFDLEILEKFRDRSWSDFSSVHLIQLLDPLESKFRFKDVIEFEDFESNEKMLLDAGAVRSDYLRALSEHQAALKKLVENYGDFHSFEIDSTKMTEQLSDFFEVM